jgi:hypothetical protein
LTTLFCKAEFNVLELNSADSVATHTVTSLGREHSPNYLQPTSIARRRNSLGNDVMTNRLHRNVGRSGGAGSSGGGLLHVHMRFGRQQDTSNKATTTTTTVGAGQQPFRQFLRFGRQL